MRPSTRAARAALAVVFASGLSACSIPVYRKSIETCPRATLPGGTDHVFVQYLGVGGVLLSRGEDLVLTGPLYSNPSLFEVLLDHEIRTDDDLVDQLLPKGAKAAKAILVGHSHYDHLMDVPYVAAHEATQAIVYGSSTTQRLLASRKDVKVVALDAAAYDPDVGKVIWTPITKTLRLLAIRSQHSDQLTFDLFDQTIPLHLHRGSAEADRAELPQRASEWAEGPVFAFLIDFLDSDEKPIFRVYYQDSGANSPWGFVPAELLPPHADGKAIDLAILCVGGAFERLVSHPRAILANTQPRFALLAHWENFFVTQRSYCVDPRQIEGLPDTKASFLAKVFKRNQTARFLDSLEQARKDLHLPTEVWLPCPTRSAFELPLAGDPTIPRDTDVTYDCAHLR